MRGPTKTIWQTRNGKRIPVRKMSDSHIINTIRMLRRNTEAAKWCTPFPSFGGEMAQAEAENEFFSLMETDVDDILTTECITFDALLTEAEHRKLEIE
jgi:hypothetical protein